MQEGGQGEKRELKRVGVQRLRLGTVKVHVALPESRLSLRRFEQRQVLSSFKFLVCTFM